MWTRTWSCLSLYTCSVFLDTVEYAMFGNMHSRVPQHNQCVSTPAVLFTCIWKECMHAKLAKLSFLHEAEDHVDNDESKSWSVSHISGGSRPSDKKGGRGASHPYSETTGGRFQKSFSALRPQFGLKIKGGSPPVPPWIRHCIYKKS